VAVNAGMPPPVRRAGLWTARDARSATLGLVAVNPSLDGADTSPRSRSELTAWLGPVAGAGRLQWSAELSGQIPEGEPADRAELKADQLPPISGSLLACAAAVALLELGLARLFSHASAPAGRSA
jgi:hypothetical protein